MATDSMTKRHRATTTDTTSVPSRANVHAMFDRISSRYDLLNHVLSFGLDFYWRHRAVSHLDSSPNQRILDLACGTGDLALAARKRLDSSCTILGIDKAPGMLGCAAEKLARHRADSIHLAFGDGMSIPVRSDSIDATMIAFGIRNMPDTIGCLREIHRILRPGGKAIILEFSIPTNRFIRSLHRLYLRLVVPGIGRLLSGDPQAYRYLDQTIETYAHGRQFCELMSEAGFVSVVAEPQSLGIVTIYVGKKS